MRLLTGAFIVMVLSSVASAKAKEALIQSGEHSNFSRLVTTLPLGAAWSVEQRGREVTLVVDGLQDGFDTTAVFDLIPRDRISEITQSGQTLTLMLGCDCRVATFTAQERYAVIDVASANVTLPVPFIDDLMKTEQATPVSILNDYGLETTANLGGTFLKADSKVLERMKVEVSKEIGSAATKGILLARRPLKLQQNLEREIARQQVVVPLIPSERTQKENVRQNIRISGSHDRLSPTTASNMGLNFTEQACVRDQDINIYSWADERSFHAQISHLRRNLYEEFDEVNPEIAQNLAKVLLHFGFGLEARLTLQAEGIEKPQVKTLLGIAEIIDSGHMSDPSTLSSMKDCEGDIALWALLAETELDTSMPISTGFALNGLGKLPEHLRSLIAPEFAERLRRYGDLDAAEAALRTLSRASKIKPPSTNIVTARLEAAKGEHDVASSRLEGMIAQNLPQSPEAIIALVDTNFLNKIPVSIETSELVEAFAQELQDTHLGNELNRVHFLSLISNGKFDSARSLLRQGDFASPIAVMKLKQIFFSTLTNTADDIVFLQHALAEGERSVSAMTDADTLVFLGRLLSLGFAGEVEEILASIPNALEGMDQQLLAAEVALSLGKPLQAKARLGTIQGFVAGQLHARADEMLGRFESAHDFYLSSGDAEKASQIAWLAEEWSDTGVQDDPVLGDIIKLTETSAPSRDVGIGLLSLSNQALAESTSARASLDALLKAPEMKLLE